MIRLGLVAPKHTPESRAWLLGFLNGVEAEPYRRGAPYDLVWFVNATEEIRFVRRHTRAKIVVSALEPRLRYPANYDAGLLRLADVYQGYRDFAGPGYRGRFLPLVFPAASRQRIGEEFPRSVACPRDHDFCLIAAHDPNLRQALARAAGPDRALLAGTLFGERVDDKLALQRRCRFELITENEINDYYVSEKIGEALLAGCVPVYYGGTACRELFGERLVVDMRAFAGAAGVPDVEAVIRHCRTPGVYARHAAAVREEGLDRLQRLSIEHCLTDPVQAFVDELRRTEFRNEHRSPMAFYWSARRRLQTLMRGTRP